MFLNRVSLLVGMLCLVYLGRAQTANVTEGCLPLAVDFTAPTGPSTFFWDFKDGATSILQNPSNTYTQAGTYIVEFKETATGPIVGTVTITVHPQLEPNIVPASPTSGCVPLAVSLSTGISLPGNVVITATNWTFGDGGGGSGTPINHLYTLAGVFDVSVELLTNMPSCDVTTIFDDYISCSNPPNASFITNPNPALACVGPLNVSFNNTSTSSLPITFDWDFGNGNTSTSQSPGAETYTTNGIYPVQLTVTDTNNCASTFVQNVTIGNPVSSFIIPDTVCINTTVNTVNTSSSGLYSWSFGPSATPTTSPLFAPSVVFTSPGLQNVTLTTTSANGLCSHDTTVAIFVEDPQVSFTSSPTYSCSEPVDITFNPVTNVNVATWQWTFGDSLTDNVSNPVHTYDIWDSIYSPYKDTILPTTLVIISTNGCIDSFASVDTIDVPQARFQPDQNRGCAPLNVVFSDSSRSTQTIVSWKWDFGDGTTITAANGNPQSHTYTIPGEYDVVLIVQNALGCIDTSYHITIEVGDVINLDFTANQTSICPGESVQFTNLTTDSTNVDAWNYTTSGELTHHCYGDDNPSFVFDDSTGLMDITLTAEYNGCYSTFTKSNYIEVKGPIAHFNHIQDCSLPYDVNFVDESAEATSVSWDLGDGNTNTALNFTHTYADTGDYWIVLTASNASSGCPDWTDSSLVHIRDIKSQFLTDSLLCAGTPIAYDATASEGVDAECYRGYTWVFSDSTMRPYTTDDPNPDLIFQSTGPQTLSLVVEDINGCKDTLTEHVVVYSVQADMNISDLTICIPDTIEFTGIGTADTTIASYNWDFGDGNTSNLQSPTHIYNTVLTEFIPVLTVTNVLGCSDTIAATISIYTPNSFLSTIPNPPNICLGDDVTFSATDFTAQGSFLNYSWDFGDGNSSSVNNTTHTYGSAGQYNAVLTYTENSSGCNNTANVTVNVQDYPLAGYSTNTDSLSVLCYPQIINFSDTSLSTSPITYTQWDFGNGIFSSNPNPSFTFEKGTHTVSLIAGTSFGCRDTVERVFEVVGPEGDFTLSPNNICKGDDILFTILDTVDVSSYSWDFGDGNSVNDVSPISHTYTFIPPSGQTLAKLTVFGPGGICPVTVEQDVFLHEVIADFDRNNELDTSFCIGETVLLTNQSLNSDVFFWTLGDGGTSTAINSLNHVYPDTGVYDITLFVESSTLGCKDTLTKSVVVLPLPEVTAVGDSVCYNDSVHLNVADYNATFQYEWTPPTVLNNPNIHNPSGLPLSNQTFTVTATDTNGCVNSSSALVIVIPPLSNYSFDTTIVVGDTAYLPASTFNGTIIFQWTPETGLSCLDCDNPWVQPLEDVSYTLFMTDIFGCSSATAYFDVYVLPETHIDLPTTFTPNGDGVNDVIYVKGWGIKDLLYFRIYNRWGELVFESDDVNVGWDGYYKGKLQNNDIYVYKVVVNTWLEEELQQEGHINLMR